MGHPRLGEKMSRQRLCGDVLLTSFSFACHTKPSGQKSVAHARCTRGHLDEHYLKNNLNVLHEAAKIPSSDQER